MADGGVVKSTTSMAAHTVKAALIGAGFRWLGRKLAGDIGDGLGAVVGGVVQHKTGDPEDLGKIIAVVGVMDMVHNITGAGGAAAGENKYERPVN